MRQDRMTRRFTGFKSRGRELARGLLKVAHLRNIGLKNGYSTVKARTLSVRRSHPTQSLDRSPSNKYPADMKGTSLFLITAITLASLPVGAAPGDLDSSFGVGGQLVTAVGAGDSGANDMAIQSDSKVVVAGYFNNGTNNDFAVVRYNADGTLDTTFNSTGIATADFSGNNDTAYGVAIQPDGKIIAVGATREAGLWLWRASIRTAR